MNKVKKGDCISVFTYFEKFSKAISLSFSYSIKQLIFVTKLEIFCVRYGLNFRMQISLGSYPVLNKSNFSECHCEIKINI